AMADNEPGERRLRIATAVSGDDAIHIDIEDNGHGIDDAETIFEPFFSTKAHGIGLGLAICRTIVSAHGGALWASSNPTRGATFHLSIPAGAAPSARDEPARAAPQAASLLFEDTATKDH